MFVVRRQYRRAGSRVAGVGHRRGGYHPVTCVKLRVAGSGGSSAPPNRCRGRHAEPRSARAVATRTAQTAAAAAGPEPDGRDPGTGCIGCGRTGATPSSKGRGQSRSGQTPRRSIVRPSTGRRAAASSRRWGLGEASSSTANTASTVSRVGGDRGTAQRTIQLAKSGHRAGRPPG